MKVDFDGAGTYEYITLGTYEYITLNEQRRREGLPPINDDGVLAWRKIPGLWDEQHPEDAAFDFLEKELKND